MVLSRWSLVVSRWSSITSRRSVIVALCVTAWAVSLRADTLVLRDGRRVEGTLVSVRDDVIEFDGQRGPFGGRERLRLDRERDDARRGRPSGLRERDVSVDSWTAWKDTGVDVRAGQMLYFSATGRVRWGPNRQDGPQGEPNSPRNDSRPIPSRPAAALIGRVGEGTEYFFIGDDEGPIRMRSGGRLYLGVNDDYLRDNTGSFRVTVYY